MERLERETILRAVRLALEEDVAGGDVTTLATVPAGSVARAWVTAREPLVLAGLAVAEEAFRTLSGELEFERQAADGDRLEAGKHILGIRGPARAMLTAERVALNFLQRLSGIATLTAQYVAVIQGTGAAILDTRKTTPGLRPLEKYAVTCGGGKNHRLGLFDQVLIKDNHLCALREAKPNAIAAAIERARSSYPVLKVEVEADTLEQVEQAVTAGADIVLLDNMSLDQLRSAVRMVAGRAKTEASGGINLETVRGIAETGVDFVSVGALTHSARAMDVALDFETGNPT